IFFPRRWQPWALLRAIAFAVLYYVRGRLRIPVLCSGRIAATIAGLMLTLCRMVLQEQTQEGQLSPRMFSGVVGMATYVTPDVATSELTVPDATQRYSLRTLPALYWVRCGWPWSAILGDIPFETIAVDYYVGDWGMTQQRAGELSWATDTEEQRKPP
ncbi:hypothetical protein FOZ60_000921, partial [Perkinsus olseni]